MKFRSRHAALPGSVTAIRVDYGYTSTAFDAVAPDSHLGKIRREVKHVAQGPRLGEKTEWCASHAVSGNIFPHRPMMHATSKFQAVRLEHNFRAAALPPVRSTTFVPTPSKNEVDKKLFLSASEKSKLTEQCTGTLAKLSRSEFKDADLGQWNHSAALSDERSNIFKHRTYADFRKVNHNKELLKVSTYVSPLQREHLFGESVRQTKRDKRSNEAEELRITELQQHGGGKERCFTMSNKDTWINRCPC